jgi:hypothetical protein
VVGDLNSYNYINYNKGEKMFRNMRRSSQQLSEQETIEILKDGSNGILSVIGDDGYPYGVPISYAYHDGKIYFHCAKSGHKLDAIKKNNKVSFTVVGQDQVLPKKLTTCYQSVIVFGIVKILDDPEEKLESHMILSNKYSGKYPEHIQKEIEKDLDNMLMVKIDIQYMTGKAGIELIKSKAIETRVYEGIIDSAMEIRQEVFVEEQGFEDEFDDIDRRATHIVLIDKYNKEEKPIATCRVFQKEGSTEEYILGRLAVRKEYRENKIGSKTIEEAEKCVRKKGGTSISLHSQCSAKGFYQKQGYEEYGKIENEQGCPHIWMKKGLKS